MTASFTHELWLEVFKHCRQPLPAPHSAEFIERSLIRQPVLGNLVQVSKLWYELAAPILYRTVVVDDIQLLFHGVHHPPIGGITPKIELLSRTKALFLVYGEPTEDGDLTIGDIEHYLRKNHELTVENYHQFKLGMSRLREIRDMARAWQEIKGDNGHETGSFMTSLQTLAVSALLGGGDGAQDRWTTMQGPSDDWDGDEEREEAEAWFLGFITAHPSIRHVCHTGFGPLSLGSHASSGANSGHSADVHTHLYSTYCFKTWPPALPLGKQLRYYLHSETDRTYASQPAAHRIDHFVSGVMVARQYGVDGPYASDDTKSWSIDCTIYASSIDAGPDDTKNLTSDWQEDAEKTLSVTVQASASGPRKLEGGQTAVDHWEVRDLATAPISEACGWRPTLQVRCHLPTRASLQHNGLVLISSNGSTLTITILQYDLASTIHVTTIHATFSMLTLNKAQVLSSEIALHQSARARRAGWRVIEQ